MYKHDDILRISVFLRTYFPLKSVKIGFPLEL